MSRPDRVDVVLVAVDLSSYSRRGLLAGRELAARLGADLHLFHAVPKDDDVPSAEADLLRFARAALGPDVDATPTVVVNLDPAGAVHEELRRLGNAVACLATHGHGRSAALIGSVATDVIVRGHDPAVLAGPLVEKPSRGSGAVGCVDDDEGATAIVATTVHWAGLLGEPAIVISVAEPAPPPVRDDAPVRRAFGPDGDVDAFLEQLVQPFRDDGVDVATAAVFDPISPGVGVSDFLRDHPVPLVVTGSHARAGLERLVFGSDAAGIVRHSSSPVLVVPLAHTTH